MPHEPACLASLDRPCALVVTTQIVGRETAAAMAIPLPRFAFTAACETGHPHLLVSRFLPRVRTEPEPGSAVASTGSHSDT
eukprot:7075884-Prymnesium_polylepis.2